MTDNLRHHRKRTRDGRAALKRMNIVSLLGFVCIICICFYVNLPLLGMGLGGGVLVMLLTVALLYQIGNMRADKL